MAAKAQGTTNALKRLFCISVTPKLTDPAGLASTPEALTIDLDRAPELESPGGALRIEGRGAPDRLIVVHGVDGRFYAFANHCACSGFRIDPVPGEPKMRCCTLGQSTFDYEGRSQSERLEHSLTTYPVTRDGSTLRVDLAGRRDGSGGAKPRA